VGRVRSVFCAAHLGSHDAHHERKGLQDLVGDLSSSGFWRHSLAFLMVRSANYTTLIRFVKFCMLAGVCAGLGEHLNIDPTVIRLGLAGK
jgi:hypothetical protein